MSRRKEKISDEAKVKAKMYNIGDEKIGMAASTFKRFGSRLFDFFIVGLPLMFMSIFWEQAGDTPVNINHGPQEFAGYEAGDLVVTFTMPDAWNSMFLTVAILSILFISLNYFILPIFFLDGKTLGKKLLGLELLQLDSKPLYQSVIIREVPLALFSLLIAVLSLSVTYDLGAIYSEYSNEYYETAYDMVNTSPLSGDQKDDWWSIIRNDGYNYNEFLNEIKSQGYISGGIYSVQITTNIFLTLYLISAIVLISTIAFSPGKRGLHDMMGGTIIVDKYRIYNKEEYQKTLDIQEKERIRVKELHEKELAMNKAILDAEARSKDLAFEQKIEQREKELYALLKNNIVKIDNCSSKLKISVKDSAKIDQKKLKAIKDLNFEIVSKDLIHIITKDKTESAAKSLKYLYDKDLNLIKKTIETKAIETKAIETKVIESKKVDKKTTDTEKKPVDKKVTDTDKKPVDKKTTDTEKKPVDKKVTNKKTTEKKPVDKKVTNTKNSKEQGKESKTSLGKSNNGKNTK